MPTLPVAIVEDEPPARAIAREFLQRIPEVHLTAECRTCDEALDRLTALRPPLVLLDVQLPDGDGFGVLEQLPYRPTVVFTTAYEQFALRAFDAAAVDYLVKPYKEVRFTEAIHRAITAAEQGGRAHSRTRAADRGPEGAMKDRLLLHVGSRAVAVDVRDVLWAEAMGDYTRLHTSRGSRTCGLGMGALEARLPSDAFLRIHRSTLVAVDAIDFIESDGAGGYFVTLTNGETVRASRSRAAALRACIV